MNPRCATIRKASSYSSSEPGIKLWRAKCQIFCMCPQQQLNNLLPLGSHHVYLKEKSVSNGCEVNIPCVFYESSKDRQEEPTKLFMLVSVKTSFCLDSCSVVYCCTLQTAILISQSEKQMRTNSGSVLPWRCLSVPGVTHFFKNRCLPKHSP